MKLFNDFISANELIEIKRCGSRFTWTNKQERPIFSNIDRILATTEWENKFPLFSASSLTRVGSDHNPILLDLGDQVISQQRQFFFEKQWLMQEGFMDEVRKKWEEAKEKTVGNTLTMDVW